MAEYYKRQPIVDAQVLEDSHESFDSMYVFIGSNVAKEDAKNYQYILVNGDDGPAKIIIGDYVTVDLIGRCKIIKADIFRKLFTAVE